MTPGGCSEPPGYPSLAVRKLAVVLVGLAAVVAAGLGQASPAARSGQCGLPDTQPLWLDYAEGVRVVPQ